jgi:hypothetical protein
MLVDFDKVAVLTTAITPPVFITVTIRQRFARRAHDFLAGPRAIPKYFS